MGTIFPLHTQNDTLDTTSKRGKNINTKMMKMTIDCSDKLKEILGSDTQAIGQHMIHAAIQVIMQKQMSQWHAHVYDKEPTHYS